MVPRLIGLNMFNVKTYPYSQKESLTLKTNENI
jgi:hypothetical protein